MRVCPGRRGTKTAAAPAWPGARRGYESGPRISARAARPDRATVACCRVTGQRRNVGAPPPRSRCLVGCDVESHHRAALSAAETPALTATGQRAEGGWRGRACGAGAVGGGVGCGRTARAAVAQNCVCGATTSSCTRWKRPASLRAVQYWPGCTVRYASGVGGAFVCVPRCHLSVCGGSGANRARIEADSFRPPSAAHRLLRRSQPRVCFGRSPVLLVRHWRGGAWRKRIPAAPPIRSRASSPAARRPTQDRRVSIWLWLQPRSDTADTQ